MILANLVEGTVDSRDNDRQLMPYLCVQDETPLALGWERNRCGRNVQVPPKG